MDPDLVVRTPEQGYEALFHPAVMDQTVRAAERRRRHRDAVLIPCSEQKPYPESRSHKHGYGPALEGKAVDVWVVSEPMGVIPYAWADKYPNNAYEFPPHLVRGRAREELLVRIYYWLREQGQKYDRLFLALPEHHYRMVTDASALGPGALDLDTRDLSIRACRASGACPPTDFRATSKAYRTFLRRRLPSS